MIQRVLLSLMFSLGCGGAPAAPEPPPKPSLPEGKGVYLLRHNPIPCVTDAQDLALELQSQVGWERVSVEDADEEQPLVEALLAEMTRDAAPRRVRGRITQRVRRWTGGHVARVLRVMELDPPPEPTD
jgi:hypothetical protein